MCVHKLQQADFNLCLIQERLFVFDDFNSDVFFFLMIVSFANLKHNKCRFHHNYQTSFVRDPEKKTNFFLRLRAQAVFDAEKFCRREAKTVSELIFKNQHWEKMVRNSASSFAKIDEKNGW